MGMRCGSYCTVVFMMYHALLVFHPLNCMLLTRVALRMFSHYFLAVFVDSASVPAGTNLVVFIFYCEICLRSIEILLLIF